MNRMHHVGLSAILALAFCAPLWAQSAKQLATPIEAQPLPAALHVFAKQTGLQLIYVSDDAQGRRTQGVPAGLSPKDALTQLLQGTSLRYEFLNERTVRIYSASVNADKISWNEATVLSPVGGESRNQVIRLAQKSSTDAHSTAPATEQHTASSNLEEITVTARRREENAQTVPISVDVFSQQTLQSNNVQTLEDLQYLVPSLSVTSAAPNEGRLSLRGQGVSGNSGHPGVIEYLNEVPVPDLEGAQNTGPGLFFDLENVQVLKGPQGTLFGRNSVGGDILLQTARPTNEFGGRFQATYGNYNDREVDGAVNIPLISDVLLTRFAINGQLRDGYTFIQGEPQHPSGIEGDNRQSWSVRGTVTFKPADWVQNDLIFTDTKFQSRGVYGVLSQIYPAGLAADGASQFQQAFLQYLAQQQALGIRTVLPLSTNDVTTSGSESLTDITRFTLNDELTLKNIASYSVENQTLEADQDNTPIQYFDIPANPSGQVLRQITEELQLNGKGLAHTLDWTVGAFYLDQPMPGNFYLQSARLFGGTPADSINRYGQSSKAVFGQGTQDLSVILPRVRFTGGLRYTEDGYSNIFRGNGFPTLCTGPGAFGCGPASQVDNAARSHAITWTAGLDYQVVDGTLLYITSRRGYRAGGFNLGAVGVANPPGFGPEYVTDLELGVKSDWHVGDIPIRTNADVWGQHYNDFQVQELFSGNFSTLTQNGGAAKLWGAELEVMAQLTNSLEVGLTYDHVNLRYTSFNPTVQASTIQSLENNTTSNNPPNKYGLSAQYRLPLNQDVGRVSVRANWNWQASGGDISIPDGYGLVKSFGLLNMAANWDRVLQSPVDVSLFASNLFNKDYLTQAVPYFQPGLGVGNQIYGEPRMYGIRARYRFGAEAR